MKNLIIYLSLLMGLVLLTAPPGTAQTLLDVGFDNQIMGAYTRDELVQDWNRIAGVILGRASITNSGLGPNGRALKIHYPKGVFGASRSGATWEAGLNPQDEMYASYYVYFSKNFDAQKGGKLPGLCGARCPAGGENVTGSTGFSARYMWSGQKIILYLYHMHMPNKFGDGFVVLSTIPRDRWIKLTQRVKLNTIGQKNGQVQVWVDDKEALSLKNLELRTSPNVKVDKFFFSTFYGGNTAAYAPLKDEYLYFDEFRVYTGKGDQMPPAPPTLGNLSLISSK